MKINTTLLLSAFTLSMLTACGNNSSHTTGAGTSLIAVVDAPAAQTLAVDAYRPPAAAATATQESSMKPRDLSVAPVAATITLGTPLASQTAAANKNNAAIADENMGKPMQIGFGREVAQTATVAATHQVLKWQASATGGQVAAINFSSTDAKAVRIGLMVTKIPETATLRFYANGAKSGFEVKGADVLAILAKNLAAGDQSNDARTYWGPVIHGANGTLEIEIPAGVGVADVDVSVPSLTHIFVSTKEALAFAPQASRPDYNLGLTCQVDVTCTTPLPAASDAVAALTFQQNGGSYICSGTLLNNNLNDSTPYLLTANHCISSQTVASTLYTEFKYRSDTCNIASISSYFPTTTTGAALLYTAYGTDSTLLRLYGAPTTSVLFAGWDATTAPAVATSIHSIHHPRGDQQRLSRGQVKGYYVRNPTDPNLFGNSTITASTILNVTLTTGLTEPGSSGSGLFKGADTNPQVIGQLFGGSLPTCGVNADNVYGRFDVAFNKGLSDHLVKGVKGVNRFYNNNSGTHFYTISAYEKDYLQTGFPTIFNYEGAPFKATTAPTAGTNPVHRFYNLNLGVYFYTINETERLFVVANLPQMRYEGIAWYANPTSVAGTVPLFRFYNRDKGVHFFTVSATERAFVIANLPQMTDEGIAYYVLP